MPDHRLSEVLRIYEAALARDAAERAAFLDGACGPDTALRREVEALLAEPSAGSQSPLDRPAWAPPALKAGLRMGPYEVEALVGSGGMGAVYRARDTRLKRTVALKVLSGVHALDPAARERFTREAHAVAALDHPHICTLYDVGSSGTAPGPVVDYLVMEYLEGETLGHRLRKGPLPLDQALECGAQIAEALAKAHRESILHRDLKPANVMLTRTGAAQPGAPHVKLLDFGLAKLKPEHPGAGEGASAISTQGPATSPGVVMGTVPYMAPEQLEGKEVDARADLFALGCVLYEMVSGRRAFEGESEASVISAIMTADPPLLSSLRPLTPSALDRLVRRCLAKNPEARWQNAADLADQLRGLRDVGASVAGTGVLSTRRGGIRAAASAVAALGLLGVGVGATWSVMRNGLPVRSGVSVLELSTRPSPGVGAVNGRSNLNRPGLTAIAVTTDGRRVVFGAGTGHEHSLWVRDIEEEDAERIPGTTRALGPFLSPDDRWVGFWVEAVKPAGGWDLKKVPIDRSGPPSFITRIDGRMPFGASWGDDDWIVFTAGEHGGLWRVPSSGGEARVVTRPRAGEYSHRLPHVLPGAKAVLFTIVESVWNWEAARIVVHRFGSDEWQTVATNAADGRYIRTGHLLYFRRGQLVAAPFDLRTLTAAAGEERSLLSDVQQATNAINSYMNTGAAQAAVSGSGTLAYLPGGEVPDVNREIVWVDRNGKVQRIELPDKPYYLPRLSPDGTRIAVQTLQSDRRVWVHDVGRPGSLDPVTNPDLQGYHHVWSWDGTRLAFCGSPGGKYGLFWVPADGTQPAGQPLSSSGSWLAAASWTRDGRLLSVQQSVKTRFDIWMGTVKGGAWKGAPILSEPGDEQDAQVSRDGRWLAYSRSEVGITRDPSVVYVRRLPELSDPKQVGRGSQPVWAREDNELFYVRVTTAGSELVAHAVAPDGTVAPTPRVLFDLGSRRIQLYYPIPGYDVMPGGQRFVFARDYDTAVPPPVTHITFIQNWFEQLNKMVPIR